MTFKKGGFYAFITIESDEETVLDLETAISNFLVTQKGWKRK